MQEKIHHHIHSSKYRFQISCCIEKQIIQIFFLSKINNYPVDVYNLSIPEKLMDEGVQKAFRKIKAFRRLNIVNPTLIYRTQKVKSPNKYLMTQQDQFQLQFQKVLSQAHLNQAMRIDEGFGNKVKYWTRRQEFIEIFAIFDPNHEKVCIGILDKTVNVKIAKTNVSLKSLKAQNSPLKGRHQQNKLTFIFFKYLISSTAFHVEWKKKILIPHHELLKPLSLLSTVILSECQQQQKEQVRSQKTSLFKHIFLTQLISHMIINQFGRNKWKHIKDRDGRRQWEYYDKDLQELRSWGCRFYQFRDHSIQRNKKKLSLIKKKYRGESVGNQSEVLIQAKKSGQQKIVEKREKKKQQREIKQQKMIEKFKKREGICNFVFISGEEKSKIDKKRYCLHQLSRQADATQALINFVQFVFMVYPRESLVPDERKKIIKKQQMTCFMDHFMSKRQINYCFREYTRESFFHKVLNIGLRVLENPDELAYLRLPFSHLFWSIKITYLREKRAIFEKSKDKNKEKTLFLYRGFEMTRKQVQIISKNIGGYAEIQGFLSTSYKQSFVSAFEINAKMTIEVPSSNLHGCFQNGLADIEKYSQHPSESEVLINAFNVFKILSLEERWDGDKDMMVYRINLEYGSIKPVENKIMKSENLLSAEYEWKVSKSKLKSAQEKLELNKEKMSEKEYENLTLLLPTAEEILRRRKKQLKQWEEEEYEEALSKLNQWEKQLIINTKHQEEQLCRIDDYGQLLFELGEFSKASVYLRRRMKQLQLEKAAQGEYWRNCVSLVLKYQMCITLLYKSDFSIGRLSDSLQNMRKLLDLYVSTNIQQKSEQFICLLFDMYQVCGHIVGKEEEKNKYKKQLITIFKKYDDLTEIKEYKQYKQIKQKIEQKENKEKKGSEQCSEQEWRKEMNERERKVKQMEDELKRIKQYTYGQYSQHYLCSLADLISLASKWEHWVLVIKKGLKYISTLTKCPSAQFRITTCNVFWSVLQSCKKVGRERQFTSTCSCLAEWMRPSIYHYQQFQLLLMTIIFCLQSGWWRAGRPILLNLITVKLKCTVPQYSMYGMILFGYVLLLLNVCQHTITNMYLQWGKQVFNFSHYTKQEQQKLFKHICEFNEDYDRSGKTVLDERTKDYFDSNIIHYARELIRKGKATFQPFVWGEDIGQMIPFQHPVHPLYRHQQHIRQGIDNYMERGQGMMSILHHQQFINMFYHILNRHNTKYYLRSLNTVGKLHISDWGRWKMGKLLEFWSWEVQELEVLQMWEMGLKLERAIEKTEHLQDEWKQQNMAAVRHNKSVTFGRWRKVSGYHLDHNKPEVQQMRKIYAKYRNYMLLTPNRRLKIARTNNKY